MSNNLTVKILKVSGLAIAAQYVGLPVGRTMPREAVTTSSGVLTRESVSRLSCLIAKGDEHAKIMRQVVVHMEITAPRYWLVQFDTYEIGREMYSESTMYQLMNRAVTAEDFSDTTPNQAIRALEQQIDRSGDLVRAKAGLPEGYLQTRLVMVSYTTLRRIWLQRRAHKLGEWHEFIEAMHGLPHCDDLIFVEPRNPWRDLWIGLLDDTGILDDDRPDTLNITDLSTDQCNEYTSAVLELLHKESTQVTTETTPEPSPWHELCQFWKTALDRLDDIPGGK